MESETSERNLNILYTHTYTTLTIDTFDIGMLHFVCRLNLKKLSIFFLWKMMDQINLTFITILLLTDILFYIHLLEDFFLLNIIEFY